jgi:hypothetical protein
MKNFAITINNQFRTRVIVFQPFQPIFLHSLQSLGYSNEVIKQILSTQNGAPIFGVFSSFEFLMRPPRDDFHYASFDVYNILAIK